jgi:uncharacterized protein (DUF1501 family)
MKRRDFLRNASLGSVIPSFANGLGLKAIAGSSMLRTLTNSATDTNHVLVIIQLSGGNDGLNMVLPLDQYTNLAAARQNILIPANKALTLNGFPKTGLHPSMTKLAQKFNEGKVSIIQGVSYPTPSFSHFRATDIWMTGSDSTQNLATGWAGRYLGNEYPNYPVGFPNTVMPDPLAIQIGTSLALTFYGPNLPMALTLSENNTANSLNNFLNLGINNSVTQVPHVQKELDYIKTVANQANKYNVSMKTAYTKGTTKAVYPNNSLANQLKLVAQMISGGMKTRIYHVSTGGFDNHSSQTDNTDTTIGTHANLLESLSDAIAAFMDDLALLGLEDRVLGMTFSEFGRRIKSNASVGTDHGSGSPMFIFGKRLHGGIVGSNPQIAAVTGIGETVPMQYDFRSVYASILKDWFCVPQTELDNILLKNFQTLKIVNSPNCISTDVHDANAAAGKNMIYNYPNPFDKSTRLKFETIGGHTMIQIFDVEGKLLATPIDKELNEGLYEVNFDSENLPSGVYYCRLQNGIISQVHRMIKVQ